MKLMHRIKHSEDTFDEPGRIQLYELIDLILWYDSSFHFGLFKLKPSNKKYTFHGFFDSLLLDAWTFFLVILAYRICTLK